MLFVTGGAGAGVDQGNLAAHVPNRHHLGIGLMQLVAFMALEAGMIDLPRGLAAEDMLGNCA